MSVNPGWVTMGPKTDSWSRIIDKEEIKILPKEYNDKQIQKPFLLWVANPFIS